MICCKLVEWGRRMCTTLAAAVGLSQSALSQHLAPHAPRASSTIGARDDATLVPHILSRASGSARTVATGFIATTEREV